MKWTIGLALIGALVSTSGWADGSGLRIEHSFNGATIQVTANQNTNLNGAAVIGSGNSANFNSSSSGSCAGACVIGNKIQLDHHKSGGSSPP
jgi:hypothetical protein